VSRDKEGLVLWNLLWLLSPSYLLSVNLVDVVTVRVLKGLRPEFCQVESEFRSLETMCTKYKMQILMNTVFKFNSNWLASTDRSSRLDGWM
jgi:hypothetical protein